MVLGVVATAAPLEEKVGPAAAGLAEEEVGPAAVGPAAAGLPDEEGGPPAPMSLEKNVR